MTPKGLPELRRAGLRGNARRKRSQRWKGPPNTGFFGSFWRNSGEICGLYNLKTGEKSCGEASPRELRQAVLLHHLLGLKAARNDYNGAPRLLFADLLHSIAVF